MWSDRAGGLFRQPTLCILFALLTIFQGIGSFFLHAQLQGGEYLDLTGVIFQVWALLWVLVFEFVVVVRAPGQWAKGNGSYQEPDAADVFFVRQERWIAWGCSVAVVFGCLALSRWEAAVEELGGYDVLLPGFLAVLAAAVVLTCALCGIAWYKRLDGVLCLFPMSVFWLLLALGVWTPEEVFHVCLFGGRSFFQLHALWHVCCSFALLCIFSAVRLLNNPCAAQWDSVLVVSLLLHGSMLEPCSENSCELVGATPAAIIVGSAQSDPCSQIQGQTDATSRLRPQTFGS